MHGIPHRSSPPPNARCSKTRLRSDAETLPNKMHRRWRHTASATTTAQAAPPGVASQLRRQTVGLARVDGAVQRRAATRTARRATPSRLDFVDLLQKGPHTGVGKNGVREKPVRHRTAPPRKRQLSRDKLPGGAHLRTPSSASRIPLIRLRHTARAHRRRWDYNRDVCSARELLSL